MCRENCDHQTQTEHETSDAQHEKYTSDERMTGGVCYTGFIIDYRMLQNALQVETSQVFRCTSTVIYTFRCQIKL